MVTQVTSTYTFQKKLSGLKEDFEKNCDKNEISESSEKLQEYKFLAILGQGAFGLVKLVKHEQTEGFFAVKILSKDKIIKSRQISHTINEKKILAAIRFPFVVHLLFSMKDNSYLYLGMPFINGGEMFTLLRRLSTFEEDLAIFYAAQVVLAFEYIHKMDLIYRDLKPENIMIDFKGFIKITDFGFCKRIKDRTYTLCGTPEYIAPEIIQNKGYGKSIDWWSFGILIYEFSAGYSPFSVGNPEQMQLMERIVAGKFKIPSKIGHELKSLIQHLLQLDLSKRYGNLKNGVDDIKNHAWFKPINWITLYNQNVKPPYVPKVSGPGDYSQFDEYDDIPLRIASKDKHEKEFADF